MSNEEVIDNYKEHWAHQTFHSDCSECFSENRLIKAHRTVNYSNHANLLKRYPALNNSYGSNYPLNFKPE